MKGLPIKVVASWSGGKESCLACYEAVSEGFEVTRLLNFISRDARRCMSHGLDSRLIAAQSQAVGIPIVQREVTWDTYEEEFKKAMLELKQAGIKGAVFGDIDVQEHKDWVDRVCAELDIEPIEPLWGIDPRKILTDFMDEGFEAIVVSVKADLFGEEWLGREIDRDFVRDLYGLKGKHDIHLCGELGEYHTFVTDGPLFKRSVKVLGSNSVLKNGYWVLDISRYEIR